MVRQEGSFLVERARARRSLRHSAGQVGAGEVGDNMTEERVGTPHSPSSYGSPVPCVKPVCGTAQLRLTGEVCRRRRCRHAWPGMCSPGNAMSAVVRAEPGALGAIRPVGRTDHKDAGTHQRMVNLRAISYGHPSVDATG